MAPSKKAASNFLVGLVVLAMSVVIGYVALTANKGRLPGSPATVVRAAFDDVGQLQVGSEVRQNGIRVGQVSAIDLIHGKPVVTMQVNHAVPMYRDGYAGIWDQSALQQKHVELRAGTPQAGLLGDEVLPTDRTESTHDLTTLLSVFDTPTRTALGSMLRQLGGGLIGSGPGLHDFVTTLPDDLTNGATLATAAAAPRTELPALLGSADRLSERFTGRERQITDLLAQTDTTLRALNPDAGTPLSDTLDKLPGTLIAVRAALRDAAQPLTDLNAATGRLRDGADSLGRATPELRAVLRNSPRPLNSIAPVATDAKPAVDKLTDTFGDARPFTDKARDALRSVALPLRVFAPYGPDANSYVYNAASALAGHDGWVHHLRVGLAPATSTVTGNYIGEPSASYPAPGQTYRQRDPNGSLIPGK